METGVIDVFDKLKKVGSVIYPIHAGLVHLVEVLNENVDVVVFARLKQGLVEFLVAFEAFFLCKSEIVARMNYNARDPKCAASLYALHSVRKEFTVLVKQGLAHRRMRLNELNAELLSLFVDKSGVALKVV